jgi:hypothetical protein
VSNVTPRSFVGILMLPIDDNLIPMIVESLLIGAIETWSK